MKPVSLFTWGSWGWGNSTRQLKEAVNAAELARGFEPPLFVDIRFQRSGRAPEFIGDYFKKVVGDSNYLWERRLGNPNIGSGPEITKSERNAAASELLDLALDRARKKQRIIFFCACVFPQWFRYPDEYGSEDCHRDGVAKLLCKIAMKRDLDIEIVEWPGLKDRVRIGYVEVKVDLFKKLKVGRRSLPLSHEQVQQFGLGNLASIPWGTVMTVRSGEDSLAVMTGPIKFKSGTWFLEVVGDGASAQHLNRDVVRFRKDAGLYPRRTKPG